MHAQSPRRTQQSTRTVHQHIHRIAGTIRHETLNRLNAGADQKSRVQHVRASLRLEQQGEKKTARNEHDDVRELLNARIGDERRQPALGVAAIQQLRQAAAHLVIVHVHGGEYDTRHRRAVQRRDRPENQPPHASARPTFTKQGDPPRQTAWSSPTRTGPARQS